MSVERENAYINNAIVLRCKFQYSQTSDYFNPSVIRQVEILDSDGLTVLETLTGSDILQDATGRYHIVASAIGIAKTIYDKWYFTVVSGAIETTKTNTCVIWTIAPSAADTYASEEDVELMLQQIEFTETSNITSNDMDRILLEKTAWINAKLHDYYETPVTDIDMLKVLRTICKHLAAAEILRIVKESIGISSELRDIVKKWQEYADGIIKEIIEGKIKFPNADRNYDTNLVHTGTVDDSGKERDPVITMDMDF